MYPSPTHLTGPYGACLDAVNAQALAYAEQKVAELTLSCDGVSCTITPPTGMPSGTVGTAYSQQVTGVGFPTPTVLAIAGGSLPPGLTITSAGLISGTPSTAGTYTFVVQLSCG